MRDISYGVLGPQATSITYVVAGGRTVTALTTGPDSAYLIVAPRRAGVHGELAAAVRRR